MAELVSQADLAAKSGGLGWPDRVFSGDDGLAAHPAAGVGWPAADVGSVGPSVAGAGQLTGLAPAASRGDALEPGDLLPQAGPPDRPVPPGPGRSATLAPPASLAGDQEARGVQVSNEGSVSRGTRPVVVPEIPPTTADTPIGRAAEAAVVVRGIGDREPWPRPPRCRIMTIANQKGGVGKTTTAVNLAASLAQHGSRVLVVDLDPQGNASTALDVEHHAGVPSVYNVLVEDRPLAEIVKPAGEMPGLYCAPATIDLAGAEIELVPVVARELRLARALRAYDMSHLDYVLVDCPPSLGLLTLNALVAAEEVLLPIQCEYYALEGVQQLLNTAELVRVNFNPGLHISTVLLTMYDGRTRLASDVADDVRAHFGTSVLRTIIPRSVRVSEAPSRGQSVITYDPGSSGAVAYVEAARELAMQSAAAR